MTTDNRKTTPRLRWWLLAAYLIAVVISHLLPHEPPQPPARSLTLPRLTADGPVAGNMELAYQRWQADGEPVVLLHGSPGSASNFRLLGPLLSEAGYDTYAIDLPGFGQSSAYVPDYSIRAHARAVRRFIEALQLDRPHLVGWSMGGGVILHVGNDHPELCRSLTLLGAIGAQENEGSGDYYFEHFKYALGYVAFVGLGELLPIPWHHARSFRHSWMRNFWDTDQRPLKDIMQTMQLPTLVLHGRHDPLVADWAAEKHYALLPNARLVMLDASHFLPFDPVETTTVELDTFFRQVGSGSIPHEYDDRAPRAGDPIAGNVARSLEAPLRDAWWLWQALLLAALALGNLWLGLLAIGFLVPGLIVDPLVGVVGLTLGRWLFVAPRWTRRLLAPLHAVALVGLMSGLSGILTPFGATAFLFGLWWLVRRLKLVPFWLRPLDPRIEPKEEPHGIAD